MMFVIPNPDKTEIINAKHQISNKSQITKPKFPIGGQLFGISYFDIVICLFFGIWDFINVRVSYHAQT
jgi:hypothetical protein